MYLDDHGQEVGFVKRWSWFSRTQEACAGNVLYVQKAQFVFGAGRVLVGKVG